MILVEMKRQLLSCFRDEANPLDDSDETSTTLYSCAWCLDNMKTGTSPRKIDVLIVACSIPPPRCQSVPLINHFKMREYVTAFHLAGMGCNTGLIALGLARDLLQVHCKTLCYALVASAEVIQELSVGKERPMMVTNCMFCSAGNAMLLSNSNKDKWWCERTMMEFAGPRPQLIKVASDALKMNIESHAPGVLPFIELCKAGWNMAQRFVLKKKGVLLDSCPPRLASIILAVRTAVKGRFRGVGEAMPQRRKLCLWQRPDQQYNNMISALWLQVKRPHDVSPSLLPESAKLLQMPRNLCGYPKEKQRVGGKCWAMWALQFLAAAEKVNPATTVQ